MAVNNCPGADRQKGTPQLTEVRCAACGYETEMFSNESEIKCPECGAVIKNTVIRYSVYKGK